MIALNEQQRAAVTAPDGPALVLAGAGSGKTRVIIERMAWLVEERGVDPRQLLALTFTNKAAGEMRQRFAARLGLERVSAWLGTFHSFGLFLLRRDIERLGRGKTFTVFDDSDQLGLMKRLVRDLPGKYERVSPREALTWISRLKQEVAEPSWTEEPSDSVEETYRVLWTSYHETLRRVSAVDFDDLLVLVVKLFEACPEVRDRYQRRYRYVLIDEYQDTNHAQYLIARDLCAAHGNLLVVGDEDQSIYSWRGADINNILDFSRDFPEATVYRLEQNYRSTKPILEAANALVAHNVNRLGKTLWTATQEGDPVRLYTAEDGEDEARFLVEDMVARNLDPKSVAVLYRTNAQSRLLEEALRKRGIRYVIVGGIKFYSRKEVKDILAYLRLLVNPDDDESVRRVLNVPARGIGGVTLERIEEYAVSRGVPLSRVLRDIETDETLSLRARQSAAEFMHLLDDLSLQVKTSEVAPLVEALLDRIKYRDYVQKSDEKDFRSRLEIVDEFLSACEQHDEEGESAGLEGFLQNLALMTDVDDWDPNAPGVTLMTCHCAKGLEFDHVYLVGLEEGLLPFGTEYDPDADIEEERRLCYVAMSRARKGLTLAGAKSRILYGKQRNDRQPSRFLKEIGVERLHLIEPEAPRTAPPAAAPVDAKALKTGTRVRHAKFGPGTVLYTQGSGDKLRARVRFDTGRMALLMIRQAPLEILEGKGR